MTITGACDISTGVATNVVFGNAAAGDADKTATGNLIVNCSTGQAYAIPLSNGSNYAAGSRMRIDATTNYIPHDLYSDAGFTTAWASVSGPRHGLDQTNHVYAKVPAAS